MRADPESSPATFSALLQKAKAGRHHGPVAYVVIEKWTRISTVLTSHNTLPSTDGPDPQNVFYNGTPVAVHGNAALLLYECVPSRHAWLRQLSSVLFCQRFL